jgi:DNA-binding LytR/AlgR family response regulator
VFEAKFHLKYLPLDIANLITIGIGNYFYAGFIENSCERGWDWFWRYQFYTFTIGIIIVALAYLVVTSVKLKMKLNDVQKINSSLLHKLKQVSNNQVFVFESETRNEKLVVYSDDLICIKAEGNYSKFYYILDDKVITKLLRLSLKNSETIIHKSTAFSRSHRSYIVNINKITNIQATGSGYQMWVNGLAEPLPASRQNIADLKQSISKEEANVS